MTRHAMSKIKVVAASGVVALALAVPGTAHADSAVSASVTTVTVPSVSPSTTVPASVPATVLGETVTKPGLAVTGTDAAQLALVGGAAIAVGAAALAARRRRTA